MPRIDADVQPLAQREITPIAKGGKETILLAEDEPSVRTFTARVLRDKGYTVLEATNGFDALQVAEGHGAKIDLLLTDVVMPRVGGKELFERLKPLRPAIKVLFTSGYTSNAIVHHGILNPGIAFLPKPFSPVYLAHKVREILDQSA